MQKRLITAVFLGLILATSMLALVLADDNSTNVAASNATMNSTRCQALNNRVEGRLSQYNEGRDKHLKSLDNLRNQFSNSMSKLEAKGFNVTQLQADVATLDEKINKTRDDYALFIQKLENTRNFTCGHSEGQFAAALQQARDQLTIVREDIMDVRSFYIGTIKKDILELRQTAREARVQQREETKTNASAAREQQREERIANLSARVANISARIANLRNKSNSGNQS